VVGVVGPPDRWDPSRFESTQTSARSHTARFPSPRKQLLGRAAAKSGKKQAALYAKVRRQLQAILAIATKAAAKGALGVPLAPLQNGVQSLLAELA